MIRHLLVLVWSRKRSSALVMLEIAACFLVVFAVAAFALHSATNWRRPLGFAWDHVWVVEIDTSVTRSEELGAQDLAALRELERAAAALPRVEAAAVAHIVPYEMSSDNGDTSWNGRSVDTLVGEVGDAYAEVMGVQVVAGRWFGPEDDAATVPPLVVNRRLARDLFGDQDPLGQVVERNGERRVVGIVDDFRQFGELSAPRPFAFERMRIAAGLRRAPRQLVLRMTPGTSAAHERVVLARLGPVVPTWSLEVQPMSRMRDTRLRFAMAPLVLGAVVGGFLLLMVGLGLLGVLWQNVTRRTRELGLRRAAGASRAAVRRQVVVELLLVASLAMVVPLVLLLQLPLFELLGTLEGGTFAGAIGASLLVVYGLCVLCGLYPATIATRVEPAEALRWE
jgi:putative ABC transport system permease protein